MPDASVSTVSMTREEQWETFARAIVSVAPQRMRNAHAYWRGDCLGVSVDTASMLLGCTRQYIYMLLKSKPSLFDAWQRDYLIKGTMLAWPSVIGVRERVPYTAVRRINSCLRSEDRSLPQEFETQWLTFSKAVMDIPVEGQRSLRLLWFDGYLYISFETAGMFLRRTRQYVHMLIAERPRDFHRLPPDSGCATAMVSWLSIYQYIEISAFLGKGGSGR
ncbi:MAG: hypothetical protein KatS3mg038_1021 [Candidatus Kapaibacterium sp.]|nr:MAG: hypothetical protein KatS3mg038_1021 [Candidatus Kapabacteria bacterium]